MGRSPFLSILLVSLIIALCFSNGFGRNLRMVEAVYSHHGSRVLLEESGRKSRMMMMETMDYSDPEPNTNIKGGYVSPPPPPPNHG